MREIKFAGRYVRRYAVFYIIGIASLLLVDLLNVYIPRFTGQITDGLESGTISMQQIWFLIGKILLFGALIAVGRFCWRYFILGPARSVEKELRDDMFGHLETLSMRYFNENKTGDLMAHFTNDLQSIRMLLGFTIITAFDASVMLVLVLAQMVVYVSPSLTVVAVIPLLLIMFGDYYYGKIMHRKFLEKQQAFSDLTDQVQEAVSGIRVIKAFVQERRERMAFARTNLYNQEKNMGVVKLQALFMPLLELVIGISGLLTLLYGGYLAIAGRITLGQFVAFNQYISMLVWPMFAAGDCITYISQGLASLKRVMVIFHERPDIVDGPDANFSIDALSGQIDIDHLTFSYPGQASQPVLKDIQLHIKAGETLAVIGRTGSGKSTLANLLLRLYDTEPDMIRIDGYSLSEIPLATLRENIAYVPQDNFLFSDTLENNIAFGSAEKDPDAVIRAAKAACVHDNIMEFPDGYQTVVGERGVTISGGQKQRCSIARALMKNAPILILDDALSAVDTDTEDRILHNLRTDRAGRTTLIIAHRISTIQNADHILVLDDGRAAEYGTHRELMEQNGIYRKIYDKQQLERQLQEEGGDL